MFFGNRKDGGITIPETKLLKQPLFNNSKDLFLVIFENKYTPYQ